MFTRADNIDISQTTFPRQSFSQTVTQNHNNTVLSIGSGNTMMGAQINYNQGNVSGISRQGSNRLTFGNTPQGDINRITFANNQRMDYSYDAYGQMTHKTAFNAVGQQTHAFFYNYNLRGELQSVSSDSFGRTFSKNGNTSSMNLSGLSHYFSVTTRVNPNNHSVNHNSTGSITPLRIEYRFNNGSPRVFTVHQNRGHVFNNRGTSMTDGSFFAMYNLDRDERLNNYTRSVATVSQERQFTYMSGTNRISLVRDNIIGRTVTTALAYDTAGNIISVSNSREDLRSEQRRTGCNITIKEV
ncbi:MAG: hypothetical protein FWE03_04870 [Firmicutes bacterium]|nr:hypothetical protein [Bacillota bacterium]